MVSITGDMEKNGLLDRRRERKVGLWVFGIGAFFFVSFFLAPLLLPNDSVPDLGARANALDYGTEDGAFSKGNTPSALTHVHEDGTVHLNEHFAWSDLDPYTAFI